MLLVQNALSSKSFEFKMLWVQNALGSKCFEFKKLWVQNALSSKCFEFKMLWVQNALSSKCFILTINVKLMASSNMSLVISLTTFPGASPACQEPPMVAYSSTVELMAFELKAFRTGDAALKVSTWNEALCHSLWSSWREYPIGWAFGCL